MNEQRRTQAELDAELARLRRRVDELEREQINRERADESLRESEEKYRTLVESAREAISIVDREGRLQYANARLAALLGARPEQVIGKAIREMFPPDGAELILQHARMVLDSEEATRFVTEIPFPDGAPWLESWLVPFRDRSGRVAAVSTFSRDITARRKAEQTLRESEAKYRLLLENVRDGIYTLDAKGRFTFVNDVIVQRSGRPAEWFLGNSFLKIGRPEDRESARKTFEAAMRGEEAPVHEIAYPTASGSLLWVELNVTPLRDGERIVGLLGVSRDVTERKQAQEQLRKAHEELEQRVEERTRELAQANALLREEIAERERAEQALRDSEERFRSVLDVSNDLIYKLNIETLAYEYVSPSSLPLLGLSGDELMAAGLKGISDRFHPDDAARVKAHFDRRLEAATEQRQASTVEYRWKHRDGQYRWYSDSSAVIRDAGGRPAALVGSIRDVTDRKRAEQALRDSEEKYRLLFETESDAIMIFDAETRQFVDVNEAAAHLYGYSREEFVRLNHADITAEPRESDASIRRATAGELSRIPLRYHRKKDGSVFPVEISAGTFTSGNRRMLCGAIRDITERQQAERALRDSEQRWRSLAENAPNIIVIVDRDSTIQFINRIPPGAGSRDVIGKKASEFLAPDYQDDARELVERVFRTGRTASREVRAPDGRGGLAWYSVQVGPIKQGGRVSAVTLIATDVTDRKQAEQELRESEERLRLALSAAEMGTWRWEPATNRDTRDGSLNRILGLAEAESTQAVEDFIAHVHPEDRDSVVEALEVARREHTPYVAEFRIVRPDGQIRWLRDQGKGYYDQTGEMTYMTGAVVDISAGKQVKEELHRSEQRNRALIEALPDTLMLLSREGVYLDIIPAHTFMGAVPADRARGRNVTEVLGADGAAEILRAVDRTLRTRRMQMYEYRVRLPDGQWRDRETRMVPCGADQVLALVRDVTDRKGAEQALRESELRYRTLVESAPLGIGLATLDGRVVGFNNAAIRMAGYSPEELRRVNLADIYQNPEDRAEMLRRLETNGAVRDFKVGLKRKDGALYVVSLNVNRLNLGGQDLLLVILEDITERKQAEQELLAYQEQLRSLASDLSLAEERERRRIADELHDRIGQGLALAKIKLGAFRGAPVPAHLDGALDEVLALLEQTIQDTRSLTFQLSPPVLYELGFEAAAEWLVEQMRQQYGIPADFEDDRRPKPMDDDVRVVLFQSLRELLVNAAKHSRARQVQVSLRRADENIRVEVTDDGVGFDVAKVGTSRESGFGLFSLRERLGHLGGSLSIESAPGKGTGVTLLAPLRRDHHTAGGKDNERSDSDR